MQKAVQQAYLDSVPMVTQVLYGWSNARKGAFLGLGECQRECINVNPHALARLPTPPHPALSLQPAWRWCR